MVLTRRVLIWSLIVLLPFIAQAQQTDSLLTACTNKNDSLRADAMLQLGKLYFVQYNDTDSLLKYSKLALNVATNTQNPSQLFQARKQIAVAYNVRGDSINTLSSLELALKQARILGDSTKVADVLHIYAAYYGNRGMNEQSLNYLISEAETAIQAKYYNATAIAYSSIAWIYRGQNQLDKMLSYHRKALAIAPLMEQNNIGNIIQVYTTSSQGYILVGEKTNNSVLIDSAKILADTVLAISQRYNRLPPQASAYLVYAYHANFYDKYESAESFALKALELRKYSDYPNQWSMQRIIASSNAHLNNRSRALSYLDSVQHSPVLNQLYYRRQLAEVECEVYTALGDYEAALKAHERLMLTQDSMDNIEVEKSLGEIEQKFNKAENEREIQRLSAEQEISSLNNKLLTAGIAAAVLLALIIFLIARQRNLKNEQERLLTEQRLNRARMDPHFLFNTFTALQGLVLKEKDSVKAAGYLSDYSVIMRQTLESTFSDLITLEDEVEYLEKYLALQQMRTGNKFDYSIEVDPEIDPTELKLPGMILQPFIENAIEHGFANITYRGVLTITFRILNEKELVIYIVDNGSGITKNERAKEYPSRATQIIRDQLHLLNKKYKSNAAFFLNANNDDPGTEVTIFLPQLT